MQQLMIIVLGISRDKESAAIRFDFRRLHAKLPELQILGLALQTRIDRVPHSPESRGYGFH